MDNALEEVVYVLILVHEPVMEEHIRLEIVQVIQKMLNAVIIYLVNLVMEELEHVHLLAVVTQLVDNVQEEVILNAA